MVQERPDQLLVIADPVDALLGCIGDLHDGVAGEVGQLHPLQVGPQPFHRVELGRIVKDRGTSPLSIIEIPHFAGTGWAAHYRVVVGVTSACLAAARKLSARARWVRIR